MNTFTLMSEVSNFLFAIFFLKKITILSFKGFLSIEIDLNSKAIWATFINSELHCCAYLWLKLNRI